LIVKVYFFNNDERREVKKYNVLRTNERKEVEWEKKRKLEAMDAKTNHVVEENADDDREKKGETRENGMRKTEVGAEKWRTQKGMVGTKRRFFMKKKDNSFWPNER